MIKGLRLVTGEELIVEALGTSNNGTFISLAVRNPLVIKIRPVADEFICDFYPWTIITEGDIYLNIALIIAEYHVPKDVENAYAKNAGDLKIVSVDKQILHG